ncbi:MAG: 4Fe-4S binding protein [Nitrospirae bacterium]|nr:4Fe-4S binding protein [Nitrospirota bacterium]MBF0541700.1 4Fe-4S binding protein [Nitrospirota bacterium]
MCEFCTSHGEGKKWYENLSNYTEEVFNSVSSKGELTTFINKLYHAMTVDIPRANNFKKRFPKIYNLIVHPTLTKYLKKKHFGQVVPIEDINKILEGVESIVRLPCVCRKATIKAERRYCLGIGFDLSPIFKDTNDFKDFERISADEAVKFIKTLDDEGQTHTIWTLKTPYIGSICNCDRDCMAYRFQVGMDLGKAMWRAEYIAEINNDLCSGCRECMKRCYYGAISYDRKNVKCNINSMKCYGCGICRAVCKYDAIHLSDRPIDITF